MFLAEELVASGGPSAPVWAFLTAITVGVSGIIVQQIQAKREAKQAKEAAQAAAQNTNSVSNGFVSRVDRKLDNIATSVDELDNAFRDHLTWHLRNANKKEN